MDILRNRVRHHLVPLLDAEFPGWRKALTGPGGLAETQTLIEDFLRASVPLCEADFFNLPLILREEAIYQKIDANGGVRGRRTVRRAALRAFCGGKTKVFEAGRLRFENNNGEITMKERKGENLSSEGFSFLPNTPLDGKMIVIRNVYPEDNDG
jgi:hypothetical protein